MNLALHGSCHVPVAAFAREHAGTLQLHGLVGSAGDGRCVRAQGEGDVSQALGRAVAAQLLAQGAGELLAAAS